MIENVLAIFEKPIYLSFEPNDPHLLHVAFGAVSSGVKVDVLLRGSAVNYAVKDQHQTDAKLLGQSLCEVETSPAKVMDLIAKNGGEVSVVEEDLKKRGLDKGALIPSAKLVSESQVGDLVAAHDATFVW